MITSEQTLARIGRRMNVSAITGFGVRGSGFGVRGSGFGVRVLAGRLNRRAVGELLRAGGDDTLAGLDALEHRIGLADDRPDFDRALLRDHLAAGVIRDERKKLSA